MEFRLKHTSVVWISIVTLMIQKTTGSDIAKPINSQTTDLQLEDTVIPMVKIIHDLRKDVDENERNEAEIDDNADVNTSPSEIIESHAMLKDEDYTEPTVIVKKRPRRKRRRRRRKRPKMMTVTMAPTTADSNAYYSILNEEPNAHKSTYYNQPENLDENDTIFRRGIGKRKRRPLKRPSTDGDISVPDHDNIYSHTRGNPVHSKNTDEIHIQENSKTSILSPVNAYDKNSNTEVLIEELKETFSKLPGGIKRRNRLLQNKTDDTKSNTDTTTTTTTSRYNDEFSANKIISEKNNYFLPDKHVISDNITTTEVSRKSNVFSYRLQDEKTSNEHTAESLNKYHTHMQRDDHINHPIIKEHNFNNVSTAEKEQTVEGNFHTNRRKFNTTKDTSSLKIKKLPPTSEVLKQIKVKHENESRSKGTSNNTIENKSNIYEGNNNATEVNATTRVNTKEENDITEDNMSLYLMNRYLKYTNETDTEENTTDSRVHNNLNNAVEKKYQPQFETEFEFPIITYIGQKLNQTIKQPITIASHENNSVISITNDHNITKICEYLTKGQLKDNKTDEQAYHILFTDQDIVKFITTFQLTTENTQMKEGVTMSSSDDEDDIFTILKTKNGSSRLAKVLHMSNTTLRQLLQRPKNNDDTGSFVNKKPSNNNTTTTTTTTVTNEAMSSAALDADIISSKYNVISKNKNHTHFKHIISNNNNSADIMDDDDDMILSNDQEIHEENTRITKPTFHDNNILYAPSIQSENRMSPIWNIFNNDEINKKPTKLHTDASREIILSYTSTENSVSTLDAIDEDILLLNEHDNVAHFKSNIMGRKIIIESGRQKDKEFHDKRKLPVGIKSAIIISGAILALIIFGFFALLLSCKIKQKRSQLRRQQDILCKQYQNREIRHQTSTSTTPAVINEHKSKYYNKGIYINGIPPSNGSSNRHYHLWKTLRKTFQYD